MADSSLPSGREEKELLDGRVETEGRAVWLVMAVAVAEAVAAALGVKAVVGAAAVVLHSRSSSITDG